MRPCQFTSAMHGNPIIQVEFLHSCLGIVVHLRIQSTQGSKSFVSLSSLGCGGIVGVGGALSKSSSSSSVFAVVGGAVALSMAMRLGACKIIRSIGLCVRRNRFSDSPVSVQASHHTGWSG